MSHARFKILQIAALAAVCGAFLPGTASAITQITNTAFVDYDNEVGTAQATVSGTTTYAAEADPLLAVLKTRTVGSGPSGTVETFVIKVTYPRISDVESVCGDDSDADSVVVTDPIPTGFTYVGSSMELSVDNGSTWDDTLTDGADADVADYNVTNAGAITVSLGTLTEGTGDAACDASTARIIRFQATKD